MIDGALRGSVAINSRWQTRHTEQVESMTGKIMRVSGILIPEDPGPGAGFADVVFPVTFIEVPVISGHCWHLDPGELLVTGAYPRVDSLGVHFYTYTEPQQNIRYYTGARLVAVVFAPPSQRVNVSFAFEGRALTNPLQRDATVDGGAPL